MNGSTYRQGDGVNGFKEGICCTELKQQTAAELFLQQEWFYTIFPFTSQCFPHVIAWNERTCNPDIL